MDVVLEKITLTEIQTHSWAYGTEVLKNKLTHTTDLKRLETKRSGKYTGESCFGCSIKIKDCEIRDKVYRSRWIPASERLPEIRLHKGEPIEFITMVKGEQAPRTLYIDREDSWRHVDSYYDPYDDYKYNVIAWQPLPEPYKEG